MKKLKLSKKTVSSLTGLEMGIVKGGSNYCGGVGSGTPGNTNPPANSGSGGGTGGRGGASFYGGCGTSGICGGGNATLALHNASCMAVTC